VLELNVWISSAVVNATQDSSNSTWNVSVKREDGTERSFVVNHLVFATGLGSDDAKLPSYPGMVWSSSMSFRTPKSQCCQFQDTFKGEIIHSTRFKKASAHEGKKVVVIGACTSGTFLRLSFVTRP